MLATTSTVHARLPKVPKDGTVPFLYWDKKMVQYNFYIGTKEVLLNYFKHRALKSKLRIKKCEQTDKFRQI